MHLPKQAAPVQRPAAPAAGSTAKDGVEPSLLGLLDPLLMLLGGVLGGR